MNTRAIAVQVLLQVIKDKRSFHVHLITNQAPNLNAQNIAFVMNLCFGTLRYYLQLEKCLSNWLKQPLKSKDLDIKLLLLIGLYQLYFSDTPPYAILHSTVEACSAKKSWAKKLINAILRQAIDHQKIDFNDINEITHSHPQWLVKLLQRTWPQDWLKILAENQKHPPMTLRANTRKINREQYLHQLDEQSINAKPLPHCDNALQLVTPLPVEKIPGFQEGLVSVQDLAACLANELLDLEDNLSVLDACAAPGGKTAHILEKANVSVMAIDQDPMRVQRLTATLERLQLAANIQCLDATQPQTWWDQKPFDRILLDAPCSGTGVIRRHPDIKLLRTEDEIQSLVRKQALLLEKLWPILKPGGILIYATCSILPSENSENMVRFLEQHQDAVEIPIKANWGQPQAVGRQILPGEETMDGFYYARIMKIA